MAKPMRKKYPIQAQERKDLKRRFTYHPPGADQPVRYQNLRDRGASLAYYIATQTPSSREQSLALTKLEEAVMWANAAIARNEFPEEEEEEGRDNLGPPERGEGFAGV